MVFVLRRCRELYNAALQERQEPHGSKRGVNVTDSDAKRSTARTSRRFVQSIAIFIRRPCGMC